MQTRGDQKLDTFFWAQGYNCTSVHESVSLQCIFLLTEYSVDSTHTSMFIYMFTQ